jgi:hypothetical protein
METESDAFMFVFDGAEILLLQEHRPGAGKVECSLFAFPDFDA